MSIIKLIIPLFFFISFCYHYVPAKTTQIDSASFAAGANSDPAWLQAQLYIRGVKPRDTLILGAGTFVFSRPVYFCDSLTVSGTINSYGSSLTKILISSNFAVGSYAYVWHTDHWNPDGQPSGGTGIIGSQWGQGPTLKGLTIQNIIIQGDSASVTDATLCQISGIRVGGSDIIIRNCDIRNMRDKGIVVTGDTNTNSNITIVKNSVHNTGLDGIYIGGIRNIILSENNIGRTRDNAIGFDCSNILSGGHYVFGGIKSAIINNVIDNSDDTSSGYYPHDGIIGNREPGSTSYYSSCGIYVGRFNDTYDPASHAYFGVESLTVANNRIISPWLHGINIDHYCRNLTIANNQVISPKKYNCITLEDYTNRITVSENYLYGSRGGYCWGISVLPLCSLVNINNNFIDTCVQNAIAIKATCNNINLNNNTIDRCIQNAITIDSLCNRISINGNKITRVPNGITIKQLSDSIAILGNTIKKVTYSPVYIYKGGIAGNGVKNLTMSSNLIDSSGGGVTIENVQQFSFVGNNIAHSPYTGLLICSGNNFFISGNLFSNNGVSGSTYLKSGIALEGYSSSGNPYGAAWNSVLITNNKFVVPSNCRALTLDNGDICTVSADTGNGGNGSYYGTNIGSNKLILNNRW